MTTLETVRNLADLANELARIPDDTPVDWETAAMMINPRRPKSRKTMYRWRYTGHGPKFSKGQGGKNADVTYLAGDVRDWIKGNRVSSTIAARLRKTMRFDTLASLTTSQPWIAHNGTIVGHALTVPDADLRSAFERVGGFHAVVATVEEVLTEHRWSDPAERAPFRKVFDAVIAARMEASKARAADTDGVFLDRALPRPDADLCPKCGRSAHPGIRCRGV